MNPIPIDPNQLTNIPLLHGAGGQYDELILFGGIGLLLVGLAFLSWKASKGKDERRRKRQARRKKR
jgi:hypothetical protein